MNQNITLSLEKEILQRGKIIAAQKNTSVSKMLGDLLKEMTEKEQAYEAAKRKALQHLQKGYHLGGKIEWTREALYDG
ncbi:MAG: hypothetical protein KKF30_18455 [Proteobacteria bacterium]|nr:hypothetical protein [Pseudomonadota bacterium]MBU4469770.1 hypothetical protein [Pseudomonadota bacterium]MCG2753005.1 DUF6364 family protein [Desulfobacteraceae bacterium]